MLVPPCCGLSTSLTEAGEKRNSSMTLCIILLQSGLQKTLEKIPASEGDKTSASLHTTLFQHLTHPRP